LFYLWIKRWEIIALVESSCTLSAVKVDKPCKIRECKYWLC
jgi:hypothetical protein